MTELKDKKCVPCEGGVEPLKETDVRKLLGQVDPDWQFVDGIKIERTFSFTDYPDVIRFANRVAEIAESEGHHPVMTLYFSKVKVELWTHAIFGLSENDFILAAKIDSIC